MPKRRVKRHLVTQPSDTSYRLIPLTQSQNAIVDSSDYEWISQWNWYACWAPHTKSFYAQRGENRKTIAMHRVILGCGPEEEGDHKNHNTLDNRRENIRIAKENQNQSNQRKQSNTSSKFKGVTWDKDIQKWRSQIRRNGSLRHLGSFVTEEEAARAYDAEAIKSSGEFSCINGV